ncbi:MAG: TIGR00266 family protein [Myxococcota bacterium]
MEHKIEFSPDFAMLTVKLNSGEQFVAESGAMVAMSPAVDIKTAARGGMLSSLKRAVLGGESIFQNTFTAKGDLQEVKFSPPSPGALIKYTLNNSSLFMQSKAYVAGDIGVNLDTKWQGAKGFFSGHGLFLLKAEGTGAVFFATYGACHEVDVKGSYVVDTGHIVAFEPTLAYKVKSVGGIKSLFFSGEGLVCEFTGNGKLWVQTRKPQSLAEFLHPFRPVKAKKN